MEIRVCRMCKKMFQHFGGPVLCPKCIKLEEELFQKVKEYLRDNPGADLVEINEATGVSVAQIERFLKEGRLEVAENSPISIKCEKCGKTIKSGRYCLACRKKMNKTLEKMRESMMPQQQVQEESNDKAKMRYLGSDKINKK